MGGSSNAFDVSTPTQDLKFMQASNINVSNFVSAKLSGHDNYKIWKAQFLCLIKSQMLLHIVDAEHPFPVDKGAHMIDQYNELVKGWIFGSVNEKVLNDLVDLGTAQVVWMKLESLFNLAVTNTEGDSSSARGVSAPDAIAPVVNAMREDLKYLQALNVDVSNYVSEKLLGKINYHTWMTEMLYLIESHELLHIIHAEARFPQDKTDPTTKKYDSLVRGWILSTMNDEEQHKYRMYRSVQLMWRKLESTFTYQPETSNSNTGDTKDALSNETKDLKYVQLNSNVNVSNFVLEKLSGHNNYNIWRAQMLCLLESHSLLHVIHDIDLFEDNKYDELVKGWIFHTMNDELLRDFQADDYVGSTAEDLWEKLESRFTDGYSRPEFVDSASTQDLRYMQASNVNVSNFVSVKLSGCSNYNIWKAQILCLIHSQKLLYVIDEEGHYTMDKYDTLVNGWIFSTMNEQLLSDLTSTDNLVSSYISAKDVWEKLKSTFDPPKSNRLQVLKEIAQTDPQGFTFGIEFIKDDTEIVSNLPELENTDKKRLFKAAAEGWWRKAKSVFKINKNAATEAITPDIEIESSRTESVKKELYEAAAGGWWRKAKSMLQNGEIAATEAIAANGNTILHIAVEMGHNYFVEELLEFLKTEEDIEKKNENGLTALHIAAIVGNTHAAQLLVQKREELLVIQDHDKKSPLDLASENMNLNIYAYLLKSSTPSDSDEYSSYYSHKSALLAAIFSKQYDIAETVLKEFPYFASNKDILMAITITFPADIGFMESFIYPSFQNVRRKITVRGSFLLHPDRCVDSILRVVKICNDTRCSWLWKKSMILFVPIAMLYITYQLIYIFLLALRLLFSMLYFLLWKFLGVIMYPIKNIEKKKKEYKDAKKILSLVCNQMGKSNEGYKDSLFEAVRLDIYEVVDEILFTSPATINCKNEEGYNIIQSSILNRAEKVYNLIYHIIERTKSHREMIDSFSNNLGHLAGRLAPSFVLDRTTGAALQLQRELLWFQQVEKLVLPLQLTKKNIYKDTPAMVFTREHWDMLKQGEMWMKTTAESCSITAALIVTVVFAAAITIPGGSNQESGIPLFKNEITFTIFAISNAFSLFTASTALLLFLSILTTRFSEKDFLVSLPRRLIFGLVNLFLSTIAMMVAFCAILFLVFCDQRPWMLAPICAFACLPISVIVTVKLPLLVDLIQSTYSPIFGKQSFLESCKVNRKTTVFTK
ncbi:hypothetical protein M8C21_018815 [Ambrosia artemisiifolia]|uniref:PGG domain-containing protein n=1 Tax=Ambrosia artemisiifolia TaxID=4212 RepID=A0AAD5CRJ0_AMBAR|nr:hypothetical protein M8C21_018815 [Ambrosia artemisiifolia]